MQSQVCMHNLFLEATIFHVHRKECNLNFESLLIFISENDDISNQLLYLISIFLIVAISDICISIIMMIAHIVVTTTKVCKFE